MIVLGLHGALESGKDTTYALIAQEAKSIGLRVQRIAFADYLKVSGALVLDGLGADPKDLSPEGRIALIKAADDFKQNGSIAVISHRQNGTTFSAQIDGRKFWQRYGTEGHREALDEPNFWVDVLFKGAQAVDDLETQYPETDILVITDVRFPNEAWAIHDIGNRGKVKRSKIARILRPRLESSVSPHVSEAGIPESLIDYEVDNSGSLDDLRDQVSILLANMLFDTGFGFNEA